jgi:M6 family metalloprotease-like protein
MTSSEPQNRKIQNVNCKSWRLRFFHFVVLYFTFCGFLLAQQPYSYHGNVHTPKGDLHMLVIFVRYEDRSLMKDTKRWPDRTEEGVLPAIAMGKVNDMFHTDPNTIATEERRNISDYFYHMSGGQFRMTADIFPVQVPIKFVPERGGNFFQRQSQMNRAAIKWITENYPDFDWSRYDQRTNQSKYKIDNQFSRPDSILDYVVFMHRAPGSTGMGASSSIDIPNSVYKIRNGHTGIKSYESRKHNLEYFKHEFAHNLYSCPHYLGANSADGNRYYTQKGWGLMAAWHSPFFVANAWEAWWLGWLEIQEVKRNGTYTLKDYMVGRDAIRIPIPGTQQHLWIENHQKIDPWDDKLFFKDANQGHPQSAAGIYMYVVGEPGANRNQPYLRPFSASNANFIRMLNGEGNFDYHFTGDSLDTGYFRGPVVEAVASNPFAGQNAYQFIRADYNHDGRIGIGMSHGNSDSGGREQMDIWNECINGQNVCTLAGTGDENDGLTVGAEVGLSGLFPVTNYPAFSRQAQSLEPYVIAGITIKVLSQDAAGNYTLDIRFDDLEVRQDQRWCGKLILNAGSDPQAPDTWLEVAKGATLSLELSGTPDRENVHPETQKLANPTHLTVEANRGIRLRSGSTLILDEMSILELKDNAQLVVERGGTLVLQGRAQLVLNDISRLIVRRGGRLIIEPDGFLRETTDATIDWERGARIRDKR